MRLYKAKSLDEYIDQLKKDIEILEKFNEKHKKGDLSGDWRDQVVKDRDTFENHSEIISVHRDFLRKKRNSI